MTFFRLAGYPPLYSGVTIITPLADFILPANSSVFSAGFFWSHNRSLKMGNWYSFRSTISGIAIFFSLRKLLKNKATRWLFLPSLTLAEIITICGFVSVMKTNIKRKPRNAAGFQNRIKYCVYCLINLLVNSWLLLRMRMR